MREIKFRAWDGEYLYYAYLGVTRWHSATGFIDIDVRGTHGLVFQQYTGLKDKNGIEIYEGDIMYCRYEDQMEEGGYGEIYVPIVFEGGSFGWIGNITRKFHSFAEEPLSEYEVIGNIYQNPELLA